MASESELLKSALHGKHVEMAATMGQEAGWLVPLSYRGVLEECAETRRRAAVFDFSHVGRLRIRGDGALALLERACTADVAAQEDDTALYTLMCNDAGGIIDQCHLLRLEGFWLLLTSPVNRFKVFEHLATLASGLDVKIDDQTERTVQIHLAGPAAPEILNAMLPEKVSSLPEGAARMGSMLVARYVAARVSYVGLWSLQVILPNMAAVMAWRFITGKAGENIVAPAGMASADVLRIEAGLPRYGHEINETIDPVIAGLMSAVRPSGGFLGAEAVARIAAGSPARRLVGIVLDQSPAGEKTAIPRQGAIVYRQDGSEAGTVTSGSYSPTLERPVALAYLAADMNQAQTPVMVEAAGKRLPARIAALPLVERKEI